MYKNKKDVELFIKKIWQKKKIRRKEIISKNEIFKESLHELKRILEFIINEKKIKNKPKSIINKKFIYISKS